MYKSSEQSLALTLKFLKKNLLAASQLSQLEDNLTTTLYVDSVSVPAFYSVHNEEQNKVFCTGTLITRPLLDFFHSPIRNNSQL